MVSQKYKDKLIEEKVKSLKQLDRIEFLTNYNGYVNMKGTIYNFIGLLLVGFIICFSIGLNFIIKAMMYRSLGLKEFASNYIGLGFWTTAMSLGLVGVGIWIFLKVDKAEKEAELKFDKFLEERSK